MKTDITIKGMHCNSCVMLLTDVLTEIAGVKSAKVSIGRAEVEFDSKKVTEKQLKQAIAAEGYEAD